MPRSWKDESFERQRVLVKAGHPKAHHAEYSAYDTALHSTKIAALRRDLKALRRADPSMHAVVFTQHTAMHAAIVAMVRSLGVAVEDLSSNAKFKQRHEAIRRFQQGCSKKKGSASKQGGGSANAAAARAAAAAPVPRVLVSTLKIGMEEWTGRSDRRYYY